MERLHAELAQKTEELQEVERLHAERSARLETDFFKKEEKLRLTVQELESHLMDARKQTELMRAEVSGLEDGHEQVAIEVEAHRRNAKQSREERVEFSMEHTGSLHFTP